MLIIWWKIMSGLERFMKEEKKFQPPSDEEIARYAYHLWESDGRIDGRDMDYWLQAKAHLTAHREYEAGVLKPAVKAAPAPVPVQSAPASKPTKGRQNSGNERTYA